MMMTLTSEAALRALWDHVLNDDLARMFIGDAPRPKFVHGCVFATNRSDGNTITLYVSEMRVDSPTAVLSTTRNGRFVELSDPIPAEVLAHLKGGAA
jgi:hypothetical protein